MHWTQHAIAFRAVRIYRRCRGRGKRNVRDAFFVVAYAAFGVDGISHAIVAFVELTARGIRRGRNRRVVSARFSEGLGIGQLLGPLAGGLVADHLGLGAVPIFAAIVFAFGTASAIVDARLAR